MPAGPLLTYVSYGVYVVVLVILGGNLWYLRRRPAPTGGALPFISVLIPARNEEANLARLLPSLLAQQYPAFEVVVYDDGSEDGTWAVIGGHADPRLKALRGSGPPPGWVGKVHALYQATRAASGLRYLFLDADARLLHAGALREVAERFEALPAGSVLTGFVRFTGGGRLLVSMVPLAILTGLPWPLVRPVRAAALGALNGQCWMIAADAYHAHEPHRRFPQEVLEDVRIGRYLKSAGMTPRLVDLIGSVEVAMYADLRDAWQGFRKNAYLIMGGRPLVFLLVLGLFGFIYAIGPLLSPWRLGAAWLIKALSDRRAGMPLGVTLLAPVSWALSIALAIDSALGHWRGDITWKGRRV